jgi:D-arabinose 1-dehydrogenase-like Zn-dependent alcohol dehydrogenase
MESDRQLTAIGAILCAAGAVISGLSHAFLTAGKDFVTGVGLGIGVVGIIVIIVGWRQSRQ